MHLKNSLELRSELVLALSSQLCREIYEEEAKRTGRPRLLLTAAVAAGKSTIDQGYEIDKISQ